MHNCCAIHYTTMLQQPINYEATDWDKKEGLSWCLWGSAIAPFMSQARLQEITCHRSFIALDISSGSVAHSAIESLGVRIHRNPS